MKLSSRPRSFIYQAMPSIPMEFPRAKRAGETQTEYESALRGSLEMILQRCISQEYPGNKTTEKNYTLAAKTELAGTLSAANSSVKTVPAVKTLSPEISIADLSSPVTPTSSQMPKTRYKKRGGVADGAGESYECKMLTLVFLRMLASVNEFQLASNMEAAGAFDDIVMRYRKQPSDFWRTGCVQLKHKQGKGKVIPRPEFLNLAGDFSLVKYCAAYVSAKSSVRKALDSSDEPRFIIFTNGIVDESLVDEVESDELLCTGGQVVSFKAGGEIYQGLCELVDFKEILKKLNEDVADLSDKEMEESIEVILGTADYKNKAVTSWKKELLKTPTLAKLKELLKKLEPVSDKETYASFLAEFQMYTGQACEWELDAKIKEELRQVWRSSNDLESDKMFNDILGGVQSWWKTCSNYLTQDSPLWLDVIKSQAGILSKDTIDGLTKTGVQFEERSLPELLDKINENNRNGILNLQVRLRSTASSLRVHQALVLTQDLNVLHVNMKALLAREDDVLSAWATRWCPLLVVECDDELDRNQASRVCEKILKVVGKKNEKKLLVLIAQEKHELNVLLKYMGNYSYFQDKCNWFDLTEEAKTEVLLQTVVINGKKTLATLEDLAGQDKEFISNVNLEVISQFIGGDFRFGKQLEREGRHFVTRRLKDSSSGLPFVVNSVRDVPGKVVLVVAEPGMGKSTLFTHLAQAFKTKDPTAWVVLIKLNDFVQYLKGIGNKTSNAEDFLEQAALHSDNTLEKLCFRALRHKLVLFVDGVDEVCPDYKREVYTLLSYLKDVPLGQLWVSSRPSCREDLEKELGVTMHRLVGFTEEDQREFFGKALQENNKTGPGDSTKKILSWLSQSLAQNNRILEVPLICFMIAETFPKMSANGEFKPSKRLNKLWLYNLMFIRKQELYCVEKKKTANRDLVGVKKDEENLRKQWLRNLTLAALTAVFSQDDVSSLQFSGKERFEEDLASFLKEVSEDLDKIGVIDSVINGVPHFVHRSFAEYLIALMLASCFGNNREFLERRFYDSAYSFIVEMLHWSLAEDHPLHVAVLERDVKATKSLLTGATPADVNEEDAGGRTPLHLAVILSGSDPHPDYIRILEVLIQKHKANLNVPDKVLGWVPLQYAEMSRAWPAIQIMLEMDALRTDHQERWPKPDSRVMYDAARDAPLPVIRYLIEVRDGQTDFQGPQGETLIHIAAHRNDTTFLEYLCTAGFSLKSRDSKGNTPLHYASESKFTQMADLLLSHGADVNAVNKKGQTVLHQAAFSNNPSMATLLLEKGASVECRDKKNDTALYIALRKGSEQVTTLLLHHGADINAVNKDGDTMLHQAASGNTLAMATLLLEKGANVECRDKKNDTALYIALRKGSEQVTALLLHHGADLNAVNKKGDTMLHQSAQSNNLAMATLLLEKGASVECRDKDGNTAIHIASKRGSMPITELLLQHGADINASNNKGETVLHFAAHRNNQDMTMLLLKNGANVECRNVEGHTALHIASRRGSVQVAALLLIDGADVNAVSNEGRTTLHQASKKNNQAVAKLLLKKGVNMECSDLAGNTALHVAARWGSKEVVDLLLRHGADVNAVNKKGKTMLHKAAWGDNLAVATLLMENGVNVVCRDLEGNTALHVAARWGSKEVADLLLRHGADVNAVDEKGKTMLHQAGQNPNLAVATLLLEKGATVECRDVNGNTAMHTVALRGTERVAELLLRHGASVNAVNNAGESSLHQAGKSNNLAVATLLLDKGASVNCRDKCGNTAMHVSSWWGNVEVTALLLRHGGDVNAENEKRESVLHQAAWDSDLTGKNSFLGQNLDKLSPNVLRWRKARVAELLLRHRADVNAVDNLGQSSLDLATRGGNWPVGVVLKGAGARVT